MQNTTMRQLDRKRHTQSVSCDIGRSEYNAAQPLAWEGLSLYGIVQRHVQVLAAINVIIAGDAGHNPS